MVQENLLFLVSQPRSGSTLLGTILSNSEKVSSLKGESWLLLPFLSLYRADLVDSTYGTDIAAKALAQHFTKKTIFTEMRDFLGKLYSDHIPAESKYLLDKTPRYYEILNEIVQCFPNAKIIILKRNPLDVYASIHQRWPRKRFLEMKDFARDLFYAPLLISRFLRQQKDNQNVFCLRYENLVNDPEQEVSKVFNWLNIPFNKGLLKYNATSTPDFGDNKFMNYSSVHSSSINNWQQLMNKKKHKSFIQGYANYLLKEGYSDYDFPSIKIHSTFRFRVLLSFSNFSSTINKELTLLNIFRIIKYYILSKVL